MMNNVVADILLVFSYLDDLFVTSPTVAANRGYFQRAMERLKKQGLVNNNEKCQFFKSHVEFPGHT